MALSLAHLQGHEFPQSAFDVTVDKVREFAAAIGDESSIDTGIAAPTFAALYALRPVAELLQLEEVAPFLSRVIHADQEFNWHRPVRTGDSLVTAGRVERVRERGGAWFVTVTSETRDSAGAAVASSSSTLVIGGAK